ncbi:hypothetical protein [Mucilaginibacter sp.]
MHPQKAKPAFPPLRWPAFSSGLCALLFWGEILHTLFCSFSGEAWEWRRGRIVWRTKPAFKLAIAFPFNDAFGIAAAKAILFVLIQKVSKKIKTKKSFRAPCRFLTLFGLHPQKAKPAFPPLRWPAFSSGHCALLFWGEILHTLFCLFAGEDWGWRRGELFGELTGIQACNSFSI